MIIKMKKLITILNIVIIITFIVMQVLILNHDSTSGQKLNLLLTEIEKVEKRNISLNQKIASVSAVASISQRASVYGFTTEREVISLTGPLPIAAVANQTF